MFTKNEIERERYDARVKWERDQASLLSDAIAQGSLIGKVQLLQRMLKLPESSEAELRNLTFEDLARLEHRLESQVFGQ